MLMYHASFEVWPAQFLFFILATIERDLVQISIWVNEISHHTLARFLKRKLVTCKVACVKLVFIITFGFILLETNFCRYFFIVWIHVAFVNQFLGGYTHRVRSSCTLPIGLSEGLRGSVEP